MNLLQDNILGVIDSYGAIHSLNTGEHIHSHERYWPNITHCRWRWGHRESLYWISAECRPNKEEEEAIRNHLTKKYGIKWWENGHHNIQALQTRFEKGITYTKIKTGWAAERGGITGEGKTKELAIEDLIGAECSKRFLDSK